MERGRLSSRTARVAREIFDAEGFPHADGFVGEPPDPTLVGVAGGEGIRRLSVDAVGEALRVRGESGERERKKLGLSLGEVADPNEPRRSLLGMERKGVVFVWGAVPRVGETSRTLAE
jgi:hypothetical protein